MLETSSNTLRLRRALGASAVVAAFCTLVPAPAGAHFILKQPPAATSQDSLGSPQKLGPCGDEAGGTATGTVTAFKQGQTITVTIDEKIFHPGHYRIALAVKDRSELPAEPVVTPANTPCGSVPIADPPVFPVLADGVLVHTQPFSGPQSVTVTLPSDVTCDKCTLQVIEFMSEHPLNNPGGCFYHHCADIAINAMVVPDAGGGGAASTGATTTTAGAGGGAAATGAGGSSAAGGDGGSGSGLGTSAGCGCSTPGGENPSLLGVGSLMALAALLRRRRRAA